ncbi:Isoflavone 2'-hydroxylase, partial [Bienertia sinuspersici]
MAPYGAHWRNLRRISTIEILSSHRLKLLAPMRSGEVKIMIQRLYKLCGWSSSEVELKPLMYAVAMNVMTRGIFGKRYYGVEEGKDFREMMEKMMRLFNDACIGDMIPCLRWLDWWKERRLRKFDVERGVLLRELVKEHKEKMKTKMEKDNGEEECKVVKPLIQAKTEIHNHVGCKRLLQESDLIHLPYLRCIINETLRMYPPAPFLVPHESSEDCIVGGYHIRRGLAIRVIGLTIGSIIQCFELERIDDELVDMTKAAGFNMQKGKPLRAMVRPRLAMRK